MRSQVEFSFAHAVEFSIMVGEQIPDGTEILRLRAVGSSGIRYTITSGAGEGPGA